jgi:hypothetical protein
VELEVLGKVIDGAYWFAIGVLFCQWAIKCCVGIMQYRQILLGFAPIFVFGIGVPFLIDFLHQIDFAKVDEIRCSLVTGSRDGSGGLTMTSCDGWILFGSTFGDFAGTVTRFLFNTGFWEKTNLAVITYVVGTWFVVRLLPAAFDFTAKAMAVAIFSSLLIAFILANAGTLAGIGKPSLRGRRFMREQAMQRTQDFFPDPQLCSSFRTRSRLCCSCSRRRTSFCSLSKNSFC